VITVESFADFSLFYRDRNLHFSYFSQGSATFVPDCPYLVSTVIKQNSRLAGIEEGKDIGAHVHLLYTHNYYILFDVSAALYLLHSGIDC
jgi:hypothetical protein